MTARKFTPISGFQRIFETGLIGLSVGALFQVAGAAFVPSIRSRLSQTACGGTVHNAAGSAFELWIADLIFFVFGVFAYLIPPGWRLLGWSIFWRPYRLLEVDYLALGLRILGFLVLFFRLLSAWQHELQ